MLLQEQERVQTIQRLLSLKINKEQELQEIAELASELCETPVALITLMDENTQYFKFRVGTDVEQVAKNDSFCQHLGNDDELLIVPDTLADAKFLSSPFVAGPPNVRFYAGVALTTHDGLMFGSLCVLDLQPKQLTKVQKHFLKLLANRVIQLMEFELSLEILREQVSETNGAKIKLHSFFDSAGALHLLIGKEQEVITFNKKMAVFLQRAYNVQLSEGLKLGDILKSGPLSRFLSEYNLALNGAHVEYERKVDYNGELIWWDVTLDPCYDGNGVTIGVSYTATDITQRKLHQQQIIEQDDCLKQIAYIQSHELRRPVATILGFMEVFKTNGYSSTAEELRMMESVTKELDKKIRTIVNFAS